MREGDGCHVISRERDRGTRPWRCASECVCVCVCYSQCVCVCVCYSLSRDGKRDENEMEVISAAVQAKERVNLIQSLTRLSECVCVCVCLRVCVWVCVCI